MLTLVSLMVDLQDRSLGENDIVEKRGTAFEEGLKRMLDF